MQLGLCHIFYCYINLSVNSWANKIKIKRIFTSTHTELFPHKRLHFLPEGPQYPHTLEMSPFHADFQKALVGLGPQPLPPTFLLREVQAAVQVFVTRWHQLTTIIKLLYKERSADIYL